MSVWLCIPSKKSAADAELVLSRWREMGYRLAIWRDAGDEPVQCDLTLTGEYPGYAIACNRLIRAVMAADAEADWFVCAGDDILPDPNHRADEIATSCERHFSPEVLAHWKKHTMPGTTFGVMQPTGDPWADSHGRMIERIAGSPWIGREFSERMYGGSGPYFEGYTHCFLDNEIMDVAKKYGVYWQRPDLTHMHQHWSRERRTMPAYLREANSPQHWQKYSTIYFQRKARGFPGCEPLPVEVCA